MFDWLTDPHIWASFIALSAMEIVLGIDNVVFISLMVSRMEESRRLMARRVGLLLALVFRIIMLAGIAWLIHFTKPAFSVLGQTFSWRDLILIAGGLFLLVKATREIHHDIEDASEEPNAKPVADSMTSAILQIGLIDIVFSVDSIITAVGMADHVGVMIAAVMVAIAVMYLASEPVAEFIERHPTTKMLALSFLMLIGVALIADGFHFHIPRGYIYSSMAFAALVEIINVVATRRRRARRKR
ncbi:Integral membrane protein TerC family protein [Methyloligella halotolerans]|uniref:Integral membrane protein TerC family protein n=1 Tax=Methyloligella halotolerans TaxID=1177755 RepID=A0A1E2S2C2_9HYPH|nr:TerC family protein [Methyloligella halotolerans]ODA68627.1 Integral membrane protein TerC family protein [Methyloligella halotolerans]